MADSEDYSLFEATEVGTTERTQGRTITEADIVNFAGVSGDFNHVHTDTEAMADSAYGERIAHGALVFSAMTGLLWQSRSARERDAVVAFYGVDELRFRAPTYIDDTLHAEFEVLEKTERDHPIASGVITYGAEMVKADGTVVLSGRLKSLVE
jgi:acyl dehydratase